MYTASESISKNAPPLAPWHLEMECTISQLVGDLSHIGWRDILLVDESSKMRKAHALNFVTFLWAIVMGPIVLMPMLGMVVLVLEGEGCPGVGIAGDWMGTIVLVLGLVLVVESWDGTRASIAWG